MNESLKMVQELAPTMQLYVTELYDLSVGCCFLYLKIFKMKTDEIPHMNFNSIFGCRQCVAPVTLGFF